MEKCKFCQEELAEGSTVCPHCGKDNAPETETVTPAEEVTEETAAVEEAAAEQTGTETPVEEETAETTEQPAAEEATEETPAETPEAPKTAPWKIVAAVAAVVVLIAALAALVIGGVKGGKTPAETTEPTVAAETAATETQVPATVPADGNPDDVTCKGTYTVTDEEAAAAKDTVVATMGDEQLTNGKLQVYYWNVVQSILSSNYGYSLMYQGLLDYSQPLDTQLCSEDSSLTWQQFFLGEALNYWQMYQSLALEAKNAGMEMPAEDREYLDGLEASLEETAANYGLSGIEELLLEKCRSRRGAGGIRRFPGALLPGKALLHRRDGEAGAHPGRTWKPTTPRMKATSPVTASPRTEPTSASATFWSCPRAAPPETTAPPPIPTRNGRPAKRRRRRFWTSGWQATPPRIPSRLWRRKSPRIPAPAPMAACMRMSRRVRWWNPLKIGALTKPAPPVTTVW